MAQGLTLSDPIGNLGLKHKSQEELRDMLLNDNSWNEKDRQLIKTAYELAVKLHGQDVYKGRPYIFHLLRVANRVSGYLRIKDAELVAAALLHDSVEDHSAEITDNHQFDSQTARQQAALAQISQQLSPKVAELVASVTNEADRPANLSEDEKIEGYVRKVKQGIQNAGGWIIKFSDWCDNGAGIIHDVERLPQAKVHYFQKKYGAALEVLEQRYQQDDLQKKLDMFAKGYIQHQFESGHTRLISSEQAAAEKKSKRFRFF